jgi:hypothetical protein
LNTRALSGLLRLDYFLPASGVLMELFRTFPWLVWFSSITLLSWEKIPLSLPSALLIIAVSCVLTKTSFGRGWSLGKTRLATLITVCVLLLLLIRLENGYGYALWDAGWFGSAVPNILSLIVAAAFGFYLMWRGIVLGREEPRSKSLFRAFLIGVVAFIVLIILSVASASATTGQSAITSLVPYILGYFAAGLITMGLTRFQSLRAGIAVEDSLFSRRWLLMLLFIVLLIIMIAALVASSLSTELLTPVVIAFNFLFHWLFTALIYIIGYPAGALATVLYYIVRFFIQFLRGETKPQEMTMPDMSDLQKRLQEVTPANWPDSVIMVLKWVVGVLVVAGIIFLLARALFRYRRTKEDSGVREISESLWSWENFKADLLAILRNLFSRFRRKPRITASPPVPPVATAIRDGEQVLDIRELYRGLLWEGHRASLPKRIGDTPYEYQSALKDALSGEHDSLSILTEAYVQQRYGHIPVKSESMSTLVQLWLRVRALLRSRIL